MLIINIKKSFVLTDTLYSISGHETFLLNEQFGRILLVYFTNFLRQNGQLLMRRAISTLQS